jgi:hypothetical protein
MGAQVLFLGGFRRRNGFRYSKRCLRMARPRGSIATLRVLLRSDVNDMLVPLPGFGFSWRRPEAAPRPERACVDRHRRQPHKGSPEEGVNERARENCRAPGNSSRPTEDLLRKGGDGESASQNEGHGHGEAPEKAGRDHVHGHVSVLPADEPERGQGAPDARGA